MSGYPAVTIVEADRAELGYWLFPKAKAALSHSWCWQLNFQAFVSKTTTSFAFRTGKPLPKDRELKACDELLLFRRVTEGKGKTEKSLKASLLPPFTLEMVQLMEAVSCHPTELPP